MAEPPSATIRPYVNGDSDNKHARFYIGRANMEGLAVGNNKGVYIAHDMNLQFVVTY